MGVAQEFRQKVIEAQSKADVGVLAFEQQLGLSKNSIGSMLFGDRPKVPSIEKAERIAHALGWEIYIGPPREGAPAPPVEPEGFRDAVTMQTMIRAIELTETGLRMTRRRASPRLKAELSMAVYRKLTEGRERQDAEILDFVRRAG